MKKIERTFISLCDEIDELKEEVSYWKNKYQEEVNERNKEWNERAKETNQGIANALLFAMSVTDDENGNLVISKEDRKQLAENWK